MLSSTAAVGALLFSSLAVAAKYDQYILAPSSRTLHPATVHKVNGTVDGADSLTGDSPGSATFHGESSVTYDFGKVSARAEAVARSITNSIDRTLPAWPQSE